MTDNHYPSEQSARRRLVKYKKEYEFLNIFILVSKLEKKTKQKSRKNHKKATYKFPMND